MHRQKPNRPAGPVKKAGTAFRLLVLLALMLCLLTGCAGKGQKTITSLDQLSEPGLRIGVPGSIIEYDMLKREYPGAEVIAYGDNPLGYRDVASGRLDVYFYERREMSLAIEHGTEGVHLLDGAYHVNDVAVGISPKAAIPDLREKINTFIAEKRADGTLDDMYDRWVVRGEYDFPDIPRAENPQYHLRVATAGTVMPYTYYVGSQLNGYDIELAYRFAYWLGADVSFKVRSI